MRQQTVDHLNSMIGFVSRQGQPGKGNADKHVDAKIGRE
jgi:hypothetical protein